MKTCFKCERVLPVDDFYAHPQMADGRLGKCKDCAKRDAKRHRQENESVRAYDRQRASLPHRIELRDRVAREWRRKHPARARAHSQALRAHAQPPERCERCNEPKRLERHHPDYSRPKLIQWLCKPCHAQADKERRAKEVA